MGNGISDNYENIELQFVIGLWKVHTATKKQTGENVCLWLLDQEKLKQQTKKKQEKEQFLKQQLEGIQQMRRLMHPHILKIFEFSEDLSTLGFSSEPIAYSLVYEANFTDDETTYIAMQLAEVAGFLHSSCKIGLLGISQESVCLTKAMEVKICDLSFASPIINETGAIVSKVGTYTGAFYQPSINFTAPEVISNHPITTSCDVFSFAELVLSCFKKRIAFSPQTAQDLAGQIQTVSSQIPTTVTPEMKELLISCLSIEPQKRPTFDAVIKSSAFQSLEMKVLKYIDMVITKDNADKFTFFKNLPSALPNFSQRMLRYKFAPVFIKEVESDIRFGPILIPFCITIGKSLPNDEFYTEFVVPLCKFFTVINPPEVLSSVFSVFNVLIEKIDKDKHYDIIYPIFIAALQSTSQKLHNEAIAKMPLMINSMTKESVETSLVPRLLEFITQSNDIGTITCCIGCLQHAAVKTDHEWFAQTVLPRLTEVVLKRQAVELADPISSTLQNIRVSVDNSLKYIIPLASSLLAIQQVERATQLQLCNTISGTVDRIKKERHLFEASKWSEKAKQSITAKKSQESIATLSPTNKPPVNPLDNETSADIFGTQTQKVQQNKPRPAVSPRQSPRISPQISANSSQEEISVGANSTSNETDEAINAVVSAPSPKKSSMFSGLTVQQGSAKPKTQWKRPHK